MNPFYLKALPLQAPFCDRDKELKSLVQLAESKNDVVLYAPRRFGKTSLVRRVQDRLAKKGAVTIYVNFFGIGSVNEVAMNLAAAVFKITYGRDPLWRKASRLLLSYRPVIRPTPEGSMEISAEIATPETGMRLLVKVLDELQDFITSTDKLVQITLDEFQELVSLPDAQLIEGSMRTHFESYQASHFFVGSRRRLLLEMFTEKQRPFFQSAQTFPLGPLPESDLVEFVVKSFSDAGRVCSEEGGREIATLTKCHPYYSQKLAFLVYEQEEEVTPELVGKVFLDLIADERAVFESKVEGLSLQQRLVLKALAREATSNAASRDYTRRHDLGSVTGINYSVKQLEKLDFIEQDKESGAWEVVDPIFSIWLSRR